MPFNTDQPHFVSLRDILAQQTNQVLVWVGAGVSAPAGVPLWSDLKKTLVSLARQKAVTLDLQAKRKLEALVDVAETENSFWRAFKYVREALGASTYRESIRGAFASIESKKPPTSYNALWQLGVTGMLTLNIDRFAERAFAEEFGNRALTSFCGVDARLHLSALKIGTPFVANLHGTIGNPESWVFDVDDLARLKSAAYQQFLSTCFTSRIILFVGISADDEAISEHLRKLNTLGDVGPHYWLTHRSDRATDEFAEAHGLLRIHYHVGADDIHHREVGQFIEAVRKYKPVEPRVSPVVPKVARERNLVLPAPEQLIGTSAEAIRTSLNKEAVRILESNDPNKIDRYQKLFEDYDSCIHRAWHVGKKSPDNLIFGYEVKSQLSKGGFGKVYLATSPEGEEVAIKILLEDVREEPGMLESFRRGVKAMEILANRGVKGVVTYRTSWEIPACTVMDYIDGMDMEQAVDSGFVTDWRTRLRIAAEVVDIIRRAHNVPEHVLHRDVRPANVMLKQFTSPNDVGDWEVVLLDFDLCWHRDAVGNSVDLNVVSKGYHAPEQIDHHLQRNRRSSLVDSYGVGMTLFFLATGKHPLPLQINHSDWQDGLFRVITTKTCPEWQSLPRRFARLIFYATQAEQNKRWDLTRIIGELQALAHCLGENLKESPAELITEEIAARCSRFTSYGWNVDTLVAETATPLGLTLKLRGDESARRVTMSIDWSNTGVQNYNTVTKYVLPSIDSVISVFKKSGEWRTDHFNREFDRLHLVQSIPLSRLESNESILAAAQTIANALSELRLS